MAKVLAEFSVSLQMTEDSWRLKRVAKLFDDSNSIGDIRKWYESISDARSRTDLQIYLFNKEDE